MVLAQDRDRFAREPAYHYLLRREFEELGCRMRSLNDRGDDSPEGELTDGILDQLAKFERGKTAESHVEICAHGRPIYCASSGESDSSISAGQHFSKNTLLTS